MKNVNSEVEYQYTKKQKVIWILLLITVLSFFAFSKYFRYYSSQPKNCCQEFYNVYQREFSGIVALKYIQKGKILRIYYDNKLEIVRTYPLSDISDVGDSIFKIKNSTLCSLRKKNGKEYILKYINLQRNCIPCPDTMRFKR